MWGERERFFVLGLRKFAIFTDALDMPNDRQRQRSNFRFVLKNKRSLRVEFLLNLRPEAECAISVRQVSAMDRRKVLQK